MLNRVRARARLKMEVVAGLVNLRANDRIAEATGIDLLGWSI